MCCLVNSTSLRCLVLLRRTAESVRQRTSKADFFLVGFSRRPEGQISFQRAVSADRTRSNASAYETVTLCLLIKKFPSKAGRTKSAELSRSPFCPPSQRPKPFVARAPGLSLSSSSVPSLPFLLLFFTHSLLFRVVGAVCTRTGTPAPKQTSKMRQSRAHNEMLKTRSCKG